MSARQSVLYRITNPFSLQRYLRGRPHDPRCKYRTYVNKGKKYPHASKREMERRYSAWVKQDLEAA